MQIFATVIALLPLTFAQDKANLRGHGRRDLNWREGRGSSGSGSGSGFFGGSGANFPDLGDLLGGGDGDDNSNFADLPGNLGEFFGGGGGDGDDNNSVPGLPGNLGEFFGGPGDDNEGNFLENLNITGGDWLPPCPPEELLDLLNITVDDMPCDPEFEFDLPDNILGNFTEDNIPCPPQELLERCNITLEDLTCNADIEFPFNFTEMIGNFNFTETTIGNFTDKIPCPPQEFLDRFNLTEGDLPCNPDAKFPDFDVPGFGDISLPCPSQEVLDRLGDHFNITEFPCDPNATRPIFGDFRPNRTSTPLDCEEPVTCGLPFDKTGVIVCREMRFTDSTRSVCVDPARARGTDKCGVCEGDSIPEPCSCECERGVLMTSSRFGVERCVSAEDSVSKQLNGRYICDVTCPSPSP